MDKSVEWPETLVVPFLHCLFPNRVPETVPFGSAKWVQVPRPKTPGSIRGSTQLYPIRSIPVQEQDQLPSRPHQAIEKEPVSRDILLVEAVHHWEDNALVCNI